MIDKNKKMKLSEIRKQYGASSGQYKAAIENMSSVKSAKCVENEII